MMRKGEVLQVVKQFAKEVGAPDEKTTAQYVSSTRLCGRSTSRTVSEQGSSAGPNRAIQRKMNLY